MTPIVALAMNSIDPNRGGLFWGSQKGERRGRQREKNHRKSQSKILDSSIFELE